MRAFFEFECIYKSARAEKKTLSLCVRVSVCLSVSLSRWTASLSARLSRSRSLFRLFSKEARALFFPFFLFFSEEYLLNRRALLSERRDQKRETRRERETERGERCKKRPNKKIKKKNLDEEREREREI